MARIATYTFDYSIQILKVQMGWVTNVKIGDLNHDGHVDVFLASDSLDQKSPAYLLYGRDDGLFDVVAKLPARYTPREAIFGDFNGDGIDDVFVANTGPDTQPAPGEKDTLLLSNGEGFKTVSVPGGKNAFSHGAATADIDHDGDLDIFVSTNGSDHNAQPYFLINNGLGKFKVDRKILPDSVSHQNSDESRERYQVVHLEDVNGDGWDDLILGKQEEPGEKGRVSKVFLSHKGRFDDDHAFKLKDHKELKHAQEVIDIGSADLDGDGKNEVIVLSQGRRVGEGYTEEWAIQVFEQHSKKGLVDRTKAFLGGDSYQEGGRIPYFLEFRDLNGDGLTDILTYLHSGSGSGINSPLFYLNTGGGKMDLVRVRDVIPDNEQQFFFGSGTVPVMHDGDLDFVSFSSDQDGNVDVSIMALVDALPNFGNAARQDLASLPSDADTLI